MTNIENSLLYNEILSESNILSGDDYKEILYTLCQIASNLVVKTLGPYGATTILDDNTNIHASKDGWSCLNRLMLGDPMYNALFNMIRKISHEVNINVGDGTTSAVVTANAFIKAFLEYSKTHTVRQSEFITTLENAKFAIIDKYKKLEEIKMIDMEGDYSDIYNIAMISSNGNSKISSYLQKIYQKCTNPNIHITIENINDIEYEIEKGYKFNCKPVFLQSYATHGDGSCHMNKKFMTVFFNESLNYNEHGRLISTLINMASTAELPMLIFVPFYDSIIASLIADHINKAIQNKRSPYIMMIQYSNSTELQKQFFSDMVMLTNSKVIDRARTRACYGMAYRDDPTTDPLDDPILEQFKEFDNPVELLQDCIGYGNYAIITKNYVVLQEYENIVNKYYYNQVMHDVEVSYNNAKNKASKATTILNQEYMDISDRYFKLKGEVVNLKVGAISDNEKLFLKDVVDDTVRACHSAFEHGYVRGMNLPLIKAIDDVRFDIINKFNQSEVNKNEEIDEKTKLYLDVLDILRKSFVSTAVCVLKNKYDEKSDEDLEEIVKRCVNSDEVYDLVSDKYQKFDNMTVINSTATDIEILKGIVSIFGLVVSSNQFITVNKIYDQKVRRQKHLQYIAEEEKIKELARLEAEALYNSSYIETLNI